MGEPTLRVAGVAGSGAETAWAPRPDLLGEDGAAAAPVRKQVDARKHAKAGKRTEKKEHAARSWAKFVRGVSGIAASFEPRVYGGLPRIYADRGTAYTKDYLVQLE